MHSVIRKVYKLMRAYKEEVPATTMSHFIDSYQNEFLDSMEVEDAGDSNEVQEQEEEEDLLQESKPLQNVPNRKQIKAQSAKLVEELSKRED